MQSPQWRKALLGAVLVSTGACHQLTLGDLQERGPTATTIHVRCRPPGIAEDVTFWARQASTDPIVTDEDEMELRLFMPAADEIFVVDANAPKPTAALASHIHWSCPARDDYFPPSSALFQGHEPCPTKIAQSEERPDPRWIGSPGDAKAGQTAKKTGPVVIHVCVRPPGAPANIEQWAAVRGSKGERWKLGSSDYDKESKDADVQFVFDESAAPESAYYFSKSHPNLRCPGKPAPKPLAEVICADGMPLLSEFAATGTTGTSTGQTKAATTTTTQGPKLESWEQFLQDFVIGTEILNGDVSGKLDDPKGSKYGVPAGKNVGGFSFPPLQATYALAKVLSAAGMTPKSFVENIIASARVGQRCVIKEVNKDLLKMADDLIAQHGRYEMAKGLEEMGAVMPYSLAEKFTEKLGAKFQAHKIFEKQAFKRFQMKGVENAPAVILDKAEHDAISAVLNPAWVKNPEMTKAELRELYKTVYAKHPEWLEAIESYLR